MTAPVANSETKPYSRARCIVTEGQAASWSYVQSNCQLTGLRTPIWETDLHLHFSIDEQDRLQVIIVNDSGKPLFGTEWSPEIASIDLFRRLDEAMHQIGEHLGPLLFDPTASIQVASEALVYAARQRLQWRMNGSYYFRHIIEYVNGWYVTDDGVVSREYSYYFIERDRLEEPDWERHILNKGWDGIVEALRVARAIHGVTVERDGDATGTFSLETL